MDVKEKANQLIKKYGTDDPFKLSALKIIITYGPLGGKYGNYMKYKRSKIIIIDPIRTPESLKPFICAHELGHAICTPDVNTSWLKTYTMSLNEDKCETFASHFAVELLLNESFMQKYPDAGIYHLAQMRGIPKNFVHLKKFRHP